MKVLVTGAHGFIGEWVMKELKTSEYMAVPFAGDVRDKTTFPNEAFDLIIHLASLITHRQSYSMSDLYDVNVRGTINLLEVYTNIKMVYISTTDVLREHLSEYAKTKLEAEKHVQNQKDYLIIRLPSVFGAKQRQVKLIPLLFEKYLRNGQCIIQNNDLREYIYVEDVARKIVADLNLTGIITYEGFKIRNYDLEKMIRAACLNLSYSCISTEEECFFSRLKNMRQCI